MQANLHVSCVEDVSCDYSNVSMAIGVLLKATSH